MSTDPRDLPTILTPNELHVLLLHSTGIGRRTGSQLLNITEDAWRWRLASAQRKITQHNQQATEAA